MRKIILGTFFMMLLPVLYLLMYFVLDGYNISYGVEKMIYIISFFIMLFLLVISAVVIISGCKDIVIIK